MIRLVGFFFDRTRKTFAGQWGMVFLFLFSMLVYSTSGFMYFEGEEQVLDWEDCWWWAVVSMTTVGYGDLYPVTMYGRLFVGLPTMLVGVAILGYILSTLAAILMENKLKELRGMSTVESENHIIICRFIELSSTIQLVNELRLDPQTKDTAVVLIDESLEELPKELAECGVTFIKGNPTRDSVLDRANLADSSSVIIQADLSDTEDSDHRKTSHPTHSPFSLPIPNILCQTISLLCGNLGNSRIGKNGDSIFCRHRFSNSFLHCSFYHLWFFSNPNWLHCQLGLDFKREIKNISLWDDGVCHAGNIIRNNLPTYLS